MVKTNDKIQRFGVVITPLSRKNNSKLQQLKRFWHEELTYKEHTKNYNTNIPYMCLEFFCIFRFLFKIVLVLSLQGTSGDSGISGQSGANGDPVRCVNSHITNISMREVCLLSKRCTVSNSK